MEGEYKNFLKANFKKLAQLIDLNQLMVSLIRKKIFSRQTLESIYSVQTETDRKQNLLIELQRLGSNDFHHFIEALQSSGHKEATELLKKCFCLDDEVDAQIQMTTANELLPKASEIDLNEKAIGKLKTKGKTKSYASSNSEVCELNVKPATELKTGQFIYKMTSRPRGLCLLINNVNFIIEKDMRKGSDRDAKALKTVFTELGFEVVLATDLTASDMYTELQKFANRPEHWHYDSCVVIILSHGGNNILYGTDKDPVKISYMKAIFNNKNCPALQEKPKMFFIQACRGKNYDCGVPKSGDVADACKINAELEKTDALLRNDLPITKNNDRLPLISDMLISYSTVEGNISIRNEVLGAWYCQELIHVLMKRSWDTPLIDMLAEVNRRVQKRVSCDGEKEATSVIMDGWNKTLYFNPKI